MIAHAINVHDDVSVSDSATAGLGRAVYAQDHVGVSDSATVILGGAVRVTSRVDGSLHIGPTPEAAEPFEVATPADPRDRATALMTVITTMMCGGWVAEQFVPGQPARLLGAAVGCHYGMRLWNQIARQLHAK